MKTENCCYYYKRFQECKWEKKCRFKHLVKVENMEGFRNWNGRTRRKKDQDQRRYGFRHEWRVKQKWRPDRIREWGIGMIVDRKKKINHGANTTSKQNYGQNVKFTYLHQTGDHNGSKIRATTSQNLIPSVNTTNHRNFLWEKTYYCSTNRSKNGVEHLKG